MARFKAELSKRNKYWIEKHRYYELYHFCQQYDIWRKSLQSLDGMHDRDIQVISGSPEYTLDKVIESRENYCRLISMVEKAAAEADPELKDYILVAVSKGLTYTQLQTRYSIPCCRTVYYDRYRKFFWILNNARN